ncbi:MAG: NADPH-dependent 7-cyano-7-deazaguanine reductase QueF [Psittacicella sp.]
MSYDNKKLSQLELGKKSKYETSYNPRLLQGVPRSLNRDQIGLKDKAKIPFFGKDLWTLYEISYLNSKGVPRVAIASVWIDYTSDNLIESKSFKLYLNSFNQTKISSKEELISIIQKDLSEVSNSNVKIQLHSLNDSKMNEVTTFDGENIDDLDIEISNYDFDSSLLKITKLDYEITEKLNSNLLKSNCLVTNQPDWGSLYIEYSSFNKIDRESLLRYLISFRMHNEFHEQCIERIFMDLYSLGITNLTVYARYTRRGGLDINPYRSSKDIGFLENIRLSRQ